VFAEMDSEDEEMAYALATGQPMVSEKERRRQVRRQEREARREERKKVKAAKEVLKQAGIDAEKLFDHGASSLKRRKRRHRKVE
jgi:DNA-binding protein H-NS